LHDKQDEGLIASIIPFPGAVMLGAINLEDDALALMENKEIHLDPTIKLLHNLEIFAKTGLPFPTAVN
jgi:hypothetical protein